MTTNPVCNAQDNKERKKKTTNRITKMEQRILTAMTQTMSTAQSRIRSELGNFPSSTTKFTVVHRRAVPSLLAPFRPPPLKGNTANSMCRYAYHPISIASAAGSGDGSTVSSASSNKLMANKTHQSPTTTSPLLVNKRPNGNIKTQRQQPPQKKVGRPALKRSLSADHLDEFQPEPAKRPFPLQIWFNNRPKGPRLPVATAHWQDSSLHDSLAFVCTKLLEASQARRYLQLQSKPRKYLHLTGGGIAAIVPPAPSRNGKPDIILPPMVVKMRPSLPVKPASAIITNAQQQRIKKIPIHQLPPPPPLISLSERDLSIPLVIKSRAATPPQQEHPLELCKRRKPSVDEDSSSSTPDSPRLVISQSSAPSSPLNLAIHNDPSASSVASTGLKRKISLPPISLSHHPQQQEPLDLATPSPTVAFRKMTLTEDLKPMPSSSNSPSTESPKDQFLVRLVLVLQVLLGKRRLLSFGHPKVPVEEVLSRVLRKAGLTPVKEVRANWISFLRLCVKNEDAWKREGWDRKTPDAILDEIYMQGIGSSFGCSVFMRDLKRFPPYDLDVVPILRKTAEAPALITSNGFLKEEQESEQGVT